MDKTAVLAQLRQDRPRFHYVGEAGVQVAASVGIQLSVGDHSWAVAPKVLEWIADHVSEEMVTIETGAGHTTVLFAALARHHYSHTSSRREEEKIRAYLEHIGIPNDKLTFVIGSSDDTLPRLGKETFFDFAYIDGCHGYPAPALDWHYIDKRLKVGGILGMDNAELRPVREHCDFLEENGTYSLMDVVVASYFARFYRKLMDQPREWVCQAYSRAKKDPCDWGLLTRIKRKASKWIKPHLY